MRVAVISRPNMRKFGRIFEVEVGGYRLLRKDGSPRRFGTAEAAQAAGEKYATHASQHASN